MNAPQLTLRDALGAATLVAGGLAFVAAEKRQKLSPLDGIWWGITTMTTVGYGDLTPRTRAGRLIAAAMMLQQFLAGRQAAAEDDGVQARLDEIIRRLDALEARRLEPPRP